MKKLKTTKKQNPNIHGKKTYYGTTKNIYLPSSLKFKTQVLKENHDSPTVGRVGLFKTYHNIRQSFFWKGLKNDIQKYVVECDTCQRHKFETVAPLGLLQPLHIPTQKWSEVSMTFMTNLPTSKGNDSIIVVVDILTKYDSPATSRKNCSTKLGLH